MALQERPIHPTARAFFDALEEQQDANSRVCERRKSPSIQKQTQTLGWRNRHSQAENYPVTVKCCEASSKSFTVKQVQRGEVEGTYGTGATVWPASMVLLKYLERHADARARGKAAVDLGAGTGITSIGAALFGASRVVCTDGNENVVELAKENLHHAGQQLNNVASSVAVHESVPSSTRIGECTVDVRQYLWGDGSFGKEKFDLILVSDCVLPKLYPIEPLVNALDELLGEDSVAILSYEHRYYPDFDPRVKFCELTRRKGLHVLVIPMDQQDPVYSVEDIELWEVRRR